ncbi:MAG TPA: hypothetical protein VHN14_28835 [Kofleriaceae bacterium]|jgi:hypothetical protein|nr:hypothetical protein [Kofleriaceae bacterium]
MRALFVALGLTAFACGGHPPHPKRGVVESDLGSWKFRRFQGPLLDVEVWVEGNKAEAFSASYITAQAEQRGHIEDQDLVNVFVTRYQNADGVVRATVKLARRLAQDGGYHVEEDKIAGARTLTITGHGEAWVMWPSNKHVVKVGGRGRSQVPASMVENYVDRYPSQLPGGALEGPLPPGTRGSPGSDEGPAKAKVEKPAYDPNNPHPDIDHYDPQKVKLPEHKDDATGDGAPAKAKSSDDDSAARSTRSTGAAKPKKPPRSK